MNVYNLMNSQRPVSYVKEDNDLFGQAWARQLPPLGPAQGEFPVLVGLLSVFAGPQGFQKYPERKDSDSLCLSRARFQANAEITFQHLLLGESA